MSRQSAITELFGKPQGETHVVQGEKRKLDLEGQSDHGLWQRPGQVPVRGRWSTKCRHNMEIMVVSYNVESMSSERTRQLILGMENRGVHIGIMQATRSKYGGDQELGGV